RLAIARTRPTAACLNSNGAAHAATTEVDVTGSSATDALTIDVNSFTTGAATVTISSPSAGHNQVTARGLGNFGLNRKGIAGDAGERARECHLLPTALEKSKPGRAVSAVAAVSPGRPAGVMGTNRKGRCTMTCINAARCGALAVLVTALLGLVPSADLANR